MSTLAIGALINAYVRAMPSDQSYVNVGLWHGFSLFAGMFENPSKRCIGIDDFSQFTHGVFAPTGDPKSVFLKEFAKRRSPLHVFHEEDYRDYFARHEGKIGVYFYDGNHAYEHQKRGLEIADPFIAPGGIVIVDDTNWDGPRTATADFMADRPGTYECVLDQKTAHNFHPTFWNGIMLLRKVR